MSARRHRGAGRSPYAFTTVERDRRYRQAYVPNTNVREKLKAGIEEFRRMLEAAGPAQEVGHG